MLGVGERWPTRPDDARPGKEHTMPTILKLQKGLQGVMRAVDEHLHETHGERIGALLFVFELGKEGGTNVVYISNAEREQMIGMVKAWLSRVEAGMTDDPIGPLGRG